VDGLIEETDRIKRERDFFKWKYEQLLLEKDKGNKVRFVTGGRLTENQLIKIVFYQLIEIVFYQLIEIFIIS
jgi:hypothetical protein